MKNFDNDGFKKPIGFTDSIDHVVPLPVGNLKNCTVKFELFY